MLGQLTQTMTTPPTEIFYFKALQSNKKKHFSTELYNLFELIKQQLMLARGPKIPQKLYLYSVMS